MAESNDLGQALIALVRDLEPGLLLLVSALCYLLALAAFAQGLMRLLKTSEDKFHAPSGGGTALSFLICIVMAALPSWLTAAGESLFGAGAASSRGEPRLWRARRRLRRAAGRGLHIGRFGRPDRLHPVAPSCCAPPPTASRAQPHPGPSPTWSAASPPGTSWP